MECPSAIFEQARIGNSLAAVLGCRDMFRVRYDMKRRSYSSALPQTSQALFSETFIRIIDEQFKFDRLRGVPDVQYQNCFRFFNAVRDEDPVSLPVLRQDILNYYPKGLSHIYYPQLACGTTPKSVYPILREISQKKLGDYYADMGEIYGELKTPYFHPMTLGEFALYRLRMGHGVVGVLANLSTLDEIQRALGLLNGVVPVDMSDENQAVRHLIHNLAAFDTVETIDDFIKKMRLERLRLGLDP